MIDTNSSKELEKDSESKEKILYLNVNMDEMSQQYFSLTLLHQYTHHIFIGVPFISHTQLLLLEQTFTLYVYHCLW